MKKMRRGTAAAIILLCVFAAGCGKKERDPASEQVLKISITPEATPTPAPDEIDPSAVVSSGNITMINSYLAEGNSSSGTDQTKDGGEDGTSSAEPSQAEMQEDIGEE